MTYVDLILGFVIALAIYSAQWAHRVGGSSILIPKRKEEDPIIIIINDNKDNFRVLSIACFLASYTFWIFNDREFTSLVVILIILFLFFLSVYNFLLIRSNWLDMSGKGK